MPTFKTDFCRFKAFCLIAKKKKNNPNPSSKKKLTSVTQLAFVKVNEALNDQLIKINIAKKGD